MSIIWLDKIHPVYKIYICFAWEFSKSKFAWISFVGSSFNHIFPILLGCTQSEAQGQTCPSETEPVMKTHCMRSFYALFTLQRHKQRLISSPPPYFKLTSFFSCHHIFVSFALQFPVSANIWLHQVNSLFSLLFIFLSSLISSNKKCCLFLLQNGGNGFLLCWF